jgi:hypothetical protein
MLKNILEIFFVEEVKKNLKMPMASAKMNI